MYKAMECDYEEKNKMKMLVILSSRGKIIFSEMEKFQRWMTNRDLKWS
jgi:hypothetical protein